MGKKKVARRSRVKPFIKIVNYAHLLPTRYQYELENLKGVVTGDTFKEPTQREDAKKTIKKAFQERHAKGANRWCMSGGLCLGAIADSAQSSQSCGSKLFVHG